MKIKVVNSFKRETIIKKETFFSGIGLHTAKKCSIIISDNPEKSGIIFICRGTKKKLVPSIIYTGDRTTSIIHNKKIFIICIEHLMSAIHGLGILNVIVELREGREIPILQGDSYSFIEKLLPNLKRVSTKYKSISIVKTIIIRDDKDKTRFIKLSPFRKSYLKIKSYIKYNNSYTKKQGFTFNFKNSQSYIDEISHARTSFPFKINDSEKFLELKKRLKGVIICGKQKNVNTYSDKGKPETYYKNEIARHKILDFLGDVKTAGLVLDKTKIELNKVGHSLNIKLASILKYEYENIK